tara:strand:+ start:2044 stop:2202 length:159 start_codon:yes stop_codon:yes gene_type:complete
MFQKFIKEFDESVEEGFELFIIFLISTSRFKLIFSTYTLLLWKKKVIIIEGM